MNTLNEQKVTLDPKLSAIPPQGVEEIVFVTSCTLRWTPRRLEKIRTKPWHMSIIGEHRSRQRDAQKDHPLYCRVVGIAIEAWGCGAGLLIRHFLTYRGLLVRECCAEEL